METTQKAKWYGPKQVGVIIYTGILMLLSACFVGGATNTVIPELAAKYGWNAQFLNVFSGIACMLEGASILLWAKIARKSPKKVAAFTLFGTAVFLVIFGLTSNITLLIIMMLLMGIMAGGYAETAAMTLTANWWPTKKGVVLGFSTMGIVLMSVVYVPYIPGAYAKFGIGGTNIALAVITAIVGIIGLIFIKDTPEEAGTTPDGLTGVNLANAKEITRQLSEYKSPYTMKKLAGSINNWLIALSVGLPLMVAMTYIASTIPALLSFGYSFPQATAIFSVGGIVSLFGSWALGVVDQKIGTKKAIIIYISFCIIALIFCLFMDKSYVCAWFAGMILFCANGAGRNLGPSYVGTVYGRWDYPAAFQLIGTVTIILCGAGVMLTGLFSSYKVMYIFDLVILVLALIITILSKDKFIGKKD